MACSTQNCICPGYGSVWIGLTPDPQAPTVIEWTRLENVDSWNLESNVTEATKKRHSDTGGKEVAFCDDIIEYTLTFVVTLCDIESQWLYCLLMPDSNGVNPTEQNCLYFFVSWSSAYINDGKCPGIVSTAPFASYTDWGTTVDDCGIYLYGRVVAPGFGVDNTSTDVATAECQVRVQYGPYFPACNYGEGDAEVLGICNASLTACPQP